MSTDPNDRPTADGPATTTYTSDTLARKLFSIDPANAVALYSLRPGDHLSDDSSVDVKIRSIARGGFGLVFFGPDAGSHGTWSALKTLKPELLAAVRDPARVTRLSQLFLREALTWVGLWPHPNLLTAQFATQIKGVLFLVLDYAAHGSLRDVLEHPERMSRHRLRRAPERLPLGAALTFAQHVAAGLVALHTPDPDHLRLDPLVHRDLKPENVLIEEHGFARITDFGLAKVVQEAEADLTDRVDADRNARSDPRAPSSTGQGRERLTIRHPTRSQRYRTQRGAALGTLAYMAPEQWIDAASAGPPADCYALGLILSELVAGRHALLDLDVPHTEDQWRVAHFQVTPRPLRAVVPELPASVEDLYTRLLAKHADDRPTAAEALAVLQQAVVTLGEDPYEPPEITPHTPEAEYIFWQRWATTHADFGLPDDALVRIDRALAINSSNYQALLNRGNVLLQLGRSAEALAAYDAALAACPSAEQQHRKAIHNQRGVLFNSAGRYAEADAAYDAALAEMPSAAGTWHNRATNQLAWAQTEAVADHLDAARPHLELTVQYAQRALQIDPHLPQPHALLAWLAQFMGGDDKPGG